MGLSIYFVTFCVLTFTATNGQLTSSPLCQTVVPAFDCSLEQPKKICASNGITYPTSIIYCYVYRKWGHCQYNVLKWDYHLSSCDFAKEHCKDVTIKYEGEGSCSCPRQLPDAACKILVNMTCPLNNFPVCASDGITYINLCSYEQARCITPDLGLNSLGTCPTLFPPTTTTTPSIIDLICQSLETIACQSGLPEVCGSDGLTYASACELEKANCKSNTTLVLEKDGAC